MLRKLLFLLLLISASLLANELENHPSPYLALHAQDPVDWRIWSQQTIDRARKENKLIFVSVGYFACHWCHVMQRESFSNRKVAARVNQQYLSIKVDRELNPEMDDRLMTFLQATTGRGGWPMNIILTPEGYPVVGFTYLPTERFVSVLDQVAEKWAKDQQAIATAAKKVDTLIAAQLTNADTVLEDIKIADLASGFLQSAMQHADVMAGGFGNTAKFPSVPQLLAMVKINIYIKRAAVDDFIQLTLDRMLHSGLYDVIDSGFFRYTVDPDWETPHFEKMLYTNTQLVELYSLAAAIYQREEYRDAAMDTLEFINKQMSADNGVLITSLSAIDNKDVEGGYYLWQLEELQKILTAEELELAKVIWDLDRPETFAAGNLPIQDQPITSAERKSKFKNLREKLHQYKAQTRRIPRDDKQLASLNGYALAVFSDAVASDQQYAESATRLARYLKKLWKNGRLAKALDANGNSLGAGSLADYAAVALGLLKWSAAGPDKDSARIGREVLFAAWDNFYDARGWQPLETSLLPNPLYQKHIQDSPEPSAETLLLQASDLLLKSESNSNLKKQLELILSRVTQGMLDDPFYYATLIGFAVEKNAASQQNGQRDHPENKPEG